ncbi:MAG: hypothetical protein H7222_00300 [Methylotenera sp.]|nr:hypothetical protein [Oligoflexia bacterium]
MKKQLNRSAGNLSIWRRRPAVIALPLIALALTVASALAHADSLSGPQLEELLVGASGDTTERCSIDYLKSLGWTIVPSVSGKLEINGGEPCQVDSIEDAKNAGALTLGLPTDVSSSELLQVLSQLPEIVKSRASRCAYKQKVSLAAKAALEKIQNNPNFVFTKKFLPLGFVDLGLFGGKRMGWQQMAAGKTLYQPRKSNSDSIESFYTKKAHLECAAGLQLAEYAIQYELYGRKDFDQAFTHAELSLGAWDIVNESDSATHGTHTGKTIEDPEAVESAKMGGKALVGRTGYLGNLYGEKFLDAPDDRGENLMIVSVDHEASESIVKAGGLAKFNAELLQVWKLNTQIKKDQDWLDKKNRKGGEASAAQARIEATAAQVESIYASDALFTQLQTYTHPFKEFKTFKEQSERLFSLNPRTPYSLLLYEDVVNEGLFERHANYMISQCVKAHPAAPTRILRPDPVATLAPVAPQLKVEPGVIAAPVLKTVEIAPLPSSVNEPDPIPQEESAEPSAIDSATQAVSSSLKTLNDYAAGIAKRYFK